MIKNLYSYHVVLLTTSPTESQLIYIEANLDDVVIKTEDFILY